MRRRRTAEATPLRGRGSTGAQGRGAVDGRRASAGTGRWLVPYADFITLLFAFFTTLYAISVTDAAKAERLVRSIRASFGDALLQLESPGLLDQLLGTPARLGEQALLDPNEPNQRLDLLGERIRELARHRRGGGVAVRRSEEGLVVSLADTVFFRGNGAELAADAREHLGEVAQLLREVPNHVRVEGHTDDSPAPGGALPTNWHLSSARAVQVLLELQKLGVDRERLSAAGFADERPLVSNHTAEGRRMNRRVDVVVLRARMSARDP